MRKIGTAVSRIAGHIGESNSLRAPAVARIVMVGLSATSAALRHSQRAKRWQHGPLMVSPAAQWVGEIAEADGIDPRTIRSVGDAKSIAHLDPFGILADTNCTVLVTPSQKRFPPRKRGFFAPVGLSLNGRVAQSVRLGA